MMILQRDDRDERRELRGYGTKFRRGDGSIVVIGVEEENLIGRLARAGLVVGRVVPIADRLAARHFRQADAIADVTGRHGIERAAQRNRNGI